MGTFFLTPSSSGAKEILWSRSSTAEFGPDEDFVTRGDYTVDAAKAPAALADVLNSLCSAKVASCSFTETSPLTWGIGKPEQKAQAADCTLTGGGAGSVGAQEPEPPDKDPDWHSFRVTAARSLSLSVGGAVTASTEANLLGIIATEISFKVEAEHEWTDTQEFSKTTRVYIPSDYIASVWVAPVVAKVTGTLLVTNGLSETNPDHVRYTITNFSETRSGVSHDDKTPAFDVITTSRPMTEQEYHDQCVAG